MSFATLGQSTPVDVVTRSGWPQVPIIRHITLGEAVADLVEGGEVVEEFDVLEKFVVDAVEAVEVVEVEVVVEFEFFEEFEVVEK